MHRYLLVSLGLVLAVLSAAPAAAQLSGHNLRGDFGLSAGTQPPPGIWVGLLYPNLDVDRLLDGSGDALPFNGDLDYQAISPWVWWVSETKILGGNYSLFAAPAWATSALEAPVLGIDSSSSWGFGDLYVQPIVLGWHRDRADYLAGLGVFAPTGRYDVDGDDNIGLGMWSFELFGGATWYLDKARAWSFAATAFYETHSSKEGTSQKVGDILTVEGGLGRLVGAKGHSVGLVYFGQWKVSDDDLGLALPVSSASPFEMRDLGRHQILGVGPEVTLSLASANKAYGALTLRYYWDFSVESNAESQTFLFNFTMPVPFLSLGG